MRCDRFNVIVDMMATALFLDWKLYISIILAKYSYVGSASFLILSRVFVSLSNSALCPLLVIPGRNIYRIVTLMKG